MKAIKIKSPPASLNRLITGAFLLALLFTGASCKKQVAAAPPPPVVRIFQVAGSDAAMDTEIIGQLDSPQTVEVRARVEAFVDKIPFAEGTEVKQGEMLFQLDKKPSQERLAAAKGLLAEAEAALNKYNTDVARLKPLAARRAIPQQDL